MRSIQNKRGNPSLMQKSSMLTRFKNFSCVFGLRGDQKEIAHTELRGNPSLMQRSSCFRLRLS